VQIGKGRARESTNLSFEQILILVSGKYLVIGAVLPSLTLILKGSDQRANM